MTGPAPRLPGAGERRPLGPGTPIADTWLALDPAGEGAAGFAYDGFALQDRTAIGLVEFCPIGIACRGEDGTVAAVRGWEREFAERSAAFERRAEALRAHPHFALQQCGETVPALGTRFTRLPVPAAPRLEDWTSARLRRPTAAEVDVIASRIAAALLALHDLGLGHGAVSLKSIRLTAPSDAVLCDIMLTDSDAGVVDADMRGLAEVLYLLVTGQTAPQASRDRAFDLDSLSARHIATGDYPDRILLAIDAALGLGRAEPALKARDWLADVAQWAQAHEADASLPSQEDLIPEVRTAVAHAAVPEATQPRSVWPMLAVASVALIAVAAWLGHRLLDGDPAPAPPIVAALPPQAVAAPPMAVSAASPPAPPAVAAAVPQAPADHLREAVASANSPERLASLLSLGADRDQARERFLALGYVALGAGPGTVFRKPGDGEALSDCDGCPELVLVPAGRVTMNLSIANTPREFAIDIPRPLAIGRYEVTRAQFAAFVAESGRQIEPGCHVRAPSWRLDPALSWREPGFPQSDGDPAVCVSYEDAEAYSVWLSHKTGRNYRLPTDAEWHALAVAEDWDRRGEAGLCAIGNGADLSALEAHPHWTAAGCRDGFIHTAPVGRFAPSLWGLHDLNGNVWEWVDTCAPEPRPDAPFPAASCPSSASRILRGGSFADPPQMRLLDARIVSAPAIRDQIVGFRVVRD